MQEKRPSKIRDFFSWVLTIALAIVAAWFINNFVLFKMVVDGPCMESTLYTGEEMYGIRIAYLFSDPERGDIVTFWAPDLEEVVYVKRIIGLPGETVEIKNGVVYIDGEALEESYKQTKMIGSLGPYEVPEDSYFMLGDNRDHSHDSVDWENTYVERNDIISKIVFRYSPDFYWFPEVNYEE